MSWWEAFAEEDAQALATAQHEAVLERMTCECGWEGIPIDHPRISPLMCGCCLKGLPGTERDKKTARCPVCNSVRLTPDEQACLECDWPDVVQSEPTTENPEDLD